MNSDSIDIHRDLVTKCLNNNREAQYQLYNLYSGAMYNTCLRMMNNSAEAADQLQEGFIEVFQKLKSFRGDSTLGAWLKRIFINRCINELKRKRIELNLTEDVPDIEEEIHYDNIEFDTKTVLNAIEKLPEGYRVVLSLFLIEGYDHKEIAEILGSSESNSKSQYHRGKKKLAEILKNG